MKSNKRDANGAGKLTIADNTANSHRSNCVYIVASNNIWDGKRNSSNGGPKAM